MGNIEDKNAPTPNIPNKEKHESLAYCLDCNDTRIITNTGTCISCGGKEIYRNGVARMLREAKEKYDETRKKILADYERIKREYTKPFGSK